MIPDFITTDALLAFRGWRPKQVGALLGRPDAIFANLRGPPSKKERWRAFFRDRVEAAEQTMTTLPQPQEAEAARMNSCGFRTLRPEHQERLLQPIHWWDDRVILRCRACGALQVAPVSCPDAYFSKCSSWHEPVPLWIEQTRSGYKIFRLFKGRRSLFAHFPDADWALSLAMAITGQTFLPHEVIPEQLELLHFAGQPR